MCCVVFKAQPTFPPPGFIPCAYACVGVCVRVSVAGALCLTLQFVWGRTYNSVCTACSSLVCDCPKFSLSGKGPSMFLGLHIRARHLIYIIPLSWYETIKQLLGDQTVVLALILAFISTFLTIIYQWISVCSYFVKAPTVIPTTLTQDHCQCIC